MSERLRSFIAFDIEDKAIIERLSNAQMELVKTGADLKLVEPKNIHITIRFLGNISPGMVEKIFKAMENVNFKPFTVEIRGLGAFPSLRFLNFCLLQFLEVQALWIIYASLAI